MFAQRLISVLGCVVALGAGAVAAPAAATSPPQPAPSPSATHAAAATPKPAPAATPTPTPTPTPSVVAGGVTADDGAFVATETQLDPRTVDLQIESPAVGDSVPVRMLLPPGWSAHATRTWPVLYLLQGAHDDYTSWTRETTIESFTADKDVIVVMPSAGPTGFPTRWWNGGKGAPDYEYFESTELMQLLERGYRASTVRAVAGVSTGGYGAMAMAAHHPGSFTAAAAYSGILDTTYHGIPSVVQGIVSREKLQPDSLWGDPTSQAQVWTAENPYALATELRFTSLFVSAGSGVGEPADNQVGATLESAVWPQAQAFADRLKVLGIPVQTDFYPGGVHDWDSWRREFVTSWPLLAAALGLPG
jgi:diacylglycerol O-acyltransferase / trehalose O-mycolyltransferase